MIPPLAFTFLHGSLRYRPYGIFVFTALCLAIGNLSENLGVLTGFPFGHYHFTEVMGPKLFHVPILLGLAYVGMGYLFAWPDRRGRTWEPLAGLSRRNAAHGRGFCHGRVGLIDGSDLVELCARLDLARGWRVLRSAGEQLLRLVFDCVPDLPVVCTLSAPKLKQHSRFAI